MDNIQCIYLFIYIDFWLNRFIQELKALHMSKKITFM